MHGYSGSLQEAEDLSRKPKAAQYARRRHKLAWPQPGACLVVVESSARVAVPLCRPESRLHRGALDGKESIFGDFRKLINSLVGTSRADRAELLTPDRIITLPYTPWQGE